MLKTYLPPEHIHIIDSAKDWQDAVEIVARPLLAGGFITSAYVQAIFDEYTKSGAYFVISPGIAVPHARPQDGVNQQGLSLLVVREGVNFDSDGDPVRLIIMLCATDNHSHISMLAQLAEMLSDTQTVAALAQTSQVAEVVSLIQSFP